MFHFKWGLFLFIFCFSLLLGQIRHHPDCPKWLRPQPGEMFPAYVNMLLALGVLVGLILHFTD